MIKARLWICGMVLGTLMCMPALSYANLLLNPGFEAGLTNWTSAGFVGTGDAMSVHTGSGGVTIIFFGGSIEQDFSVPDAASLYLSAWIRLYTNSYVGNTGVAQVTLKLPGDNNVLMGGPVDGLGFVFEQDDDGFWLSNWIRLEGIVELSGVPVGSKAFIDISFVPGDGSGLLTSLFVDDVLVQHTPLPWAVSLLGSGLLGLLALRNKLRFR
ncbi:MAG: hypothetical protein HY788_16880 [Deltaproteobacteria bacterium]|nr:hypothetical protein [Deltaproteobacteria bacterium]